jgi:hypothetical protein
MIEVKGKIIKESGNFYLEIPVKNFAKYGSVQNNQYRITNIPNEKLEEYIGKNVIITAEYIRTVPTTLEQLLVDEHGGKIYSSIKLVNK